MVSDIFPMHWVSIGHLWNIGQSRARGHTMRFDNRFLNCEVFDIIS